jgi:hypothetical protein
MEHYRGKQSPQYLVLDAADVAAAFPPTVDSVAAHALSNTATAAAERLALNVLKFLFMRIPNESC